jgi:hypothetical protein
LKHSTRDAITLHYPAVFRVDLADRAAAVFKTLRFIKARRTFDMARLLDELTVATGVEWSREIERAFADELLMNLLRHRRPAEWQVLAEVVYSDPRHAIYLGDMPHTWIGAEYARTLFGMLMHEGDDRLSLLPGTPPSWVAGEGLTVSELPTAYGRLTMAARQQDGTLRVVLGPGIRKDAALEVRWPDRTRPTSVTVDGRRLSAYDAEGVRLDKPFKELVATW